MPEPTLRPGETLLPIPRLVRRPLAAWAQELLVALPAALAGGGRALAEVANQAALLEHYAGRRGRARAICEAQMGLAAARGRPSLGLQPQINLARLDAFEGDLRGAVARLEGVERGLVERSRGAAADADLDEHGARVVDACVIESLHHRLRLGDRPALARSLALQRRARPHLEPFLAEVELHVRLVDDPAAACAEAGALVERFEGATRVVFALFLGEALHRSGSAEGACAVARALVARLAAEWDDVEGPVALRICERLAASALAWGARDVSRALAAEALEVAVALEDEPATLGLLETLALAGDAGLCDQARRAAATLRGATGYVALASTTPTNPEVAALSAALVDALVAAAGGGGLES